MLDVYFLVLYQNKILKLHPYNFFSQQYLSIKSTLATVHSKATVQPPSLIPFQVM